MSTPDYLHLFKSLLLGRRPEKRDIAVCIECKLTENECVLDRGMFCFGPVTRAGCGAICPSNGQYCTGCRGTISNINRNGARQMLKRHGLSNHEAEKRLKMFCAYELA